MKVSTPLGEYPFLFDRVERRGGGVAIVGTVAGLESSVLLGPEDVRGVARKLALPLALGAVLLAASRSRR